MIYIQSSEHNEIEINKSRFIGTIYPVLSKDDVKHLLFELKKVYPKANHYCYAAILGDRGDTHMASDDGEPQKTAGVPILDVLKHHMITNACVVVIRYFGGIKLGSGGLIRAYAKTAASVIDKAKLYEKKIFDVYEITFDYPLIDTIDHYFDQSASIINKTFLKDVTYEVIFDKKDASMLDEIKHLLKTTKKLLPKTAYIPL